MPNKKGTRARFGAVRKRSSGRLQARYTCPRNPSKGHSAPHTFLTDGDARRWLAKVETDISRGEWHDPCEGAPKRPTTLREFTRNWLGTRKLRERTRVEYDRMLEDHIYPAFGDRELPDIEPTDVDEWYCGLLVNQPSHRANVYTLLSGIMNAAVKKRQVSFNPCTIEGATGKKRASAIATAEANEIDIIVANMPERFRALVLLGSWCALRFGELTELRRSDIKIIDGIAVLHVARAVTHTKESGCTIGEPKTEEGTRYVHIPPHVWPEIERHLNEHTDSGKNALLFPGPRTKCGHIRSSSLSRYWIPARKKAGRTDLRVHDLRATCATMAAQNGATIKELMSLLGHTTPHVAMKYQNATQKRLRELAERMSSDVIPINRKKKKGEEDSKTERSA